MDTKRVCIAWLGFNHAVPPAWQVKACLDVEVVGISRSIKTAPKERFFCSRPECLTAQVGVAHFRVVEQFFTAALHDDAPVFQHIATVG